MGVPGRQPLRRRVERQPGPPGDPVEPGVPEDDHVRPDGRRQRATAAGPGRPPDLEDVRVVGLEVEPERDLDRVGAVVAQPQPLVAGGVPQEDPAGQVDGAAGGRTGTDY